jgi:hypothetical protein
MKIYKILIIGILFLAMVGAVRADPILASVSLKVYRDGSQAQMEKVEIFTQYPEYMKNLLGNTDYYGSHVYDLYVLDDLGNIVWEKRLNTDFVAYSNPPILLDNNLIETFLLFERENTLKLYDEGGTLLLETVLDFCDDDGNCEITENENAVTCQEDCDVNNDEYCDLNYDGICDRDCPEYYDNDCEAAASKRRQIKAAFIDEPDKTTETPNLILRFFEWMFSGFK